MNKRFIYGTTHHYLLQLFTKGYKKDKMFDVSIFMFHGHSTVSSKPIHANNK